MLKGLSDVRVVGVEGGVWGTEDTPPITALKGSDWPDTIKALAAS